MEKTIELISGKLNNVEKDLSNLWGYVNEIADVTNTNANINSSNAEIIETALKKGKDGCTEVLKWIKSQSRFNKFMFVGFIAGGYILYKQDKAIKELQAKNEEQVTTEE